QLLAETLQVRLQSTDILPHPAVICGFLCCDFGMRGLSTMHFGGLTDKERRQPSIASALSGLAAVTELIYLPFMANMEKAREFVSKLTRSRLSRSFGIPEARSELVHWVDERFESMRLLLAQDQIEAAQAVHESFHEGDASFTRLMQVVNECRL
ncbi:hypothetical protein PHYSODRAFT_434215, partial [Phytophthora sojae]